MALQERPVRIAIIGVGGIGPRHAQSVAACPDAVLTAFVDPNPQAKATAEAFNVPLFTSLQELVASKQTPEAAIVCTPNSTHVSLSEQLLQLGIHVLVEKPVAVDMASGQRLAKTARASSKKVLVGHHRRFNSYVDAAKRTLTSGTIGRPIALSGLWTLCKPSSYYHAPMEWHASAEVGGTIAINLIHDIDVLTYLLGPIVRVYAEQTVSQREHAAEEGAAVLLRFASGVVGTFVLSDATPSPHSFEAGTGENPGIARSGKDFYRIFGSEGTLSVGDMKIFRHRVGEEKTWSNQLVEDVIEVEGQVPFDEQVKHFVNVVREAEEPRCTIEDGMRALMVTEAVKEAVRTGIPVDIARPSKL